MTEEEKELSHLKASVAWHADRLARQSLITEAILDAQGTIGIDIEFILDRLRGPEVPASSIISGLVQPERRRVMAVLHYLVETGVVRRRAVRGHGTYYSIQIPESGEK